MLSDVRGEDESFRFDSEFFRKDDINRLRQLGLLSHSSLIELSRRIDVGYVGEMTSEYTTDATAPKLIQTRNIDEFIPNDTDIIHISQEFHEQLRKSQIHTNDILLARSGSFGNAAIWLDKETVNSSDIIIIDVDPSKIDPCYLVAFLNSRYGRFQLDRYASGAVQRHVNLTILERLNIALLSEDVRSFVGSLVRQAFKTITDSRACYRAAEDKLLKDLGFLNWSPVDGGVSVKPFSEVANACRIDAEYFQPKFDELKQLLAQCELRDLGGNEGLVNIYKSIDPPSDCYGSEGVPFVRISDFSKFGIEIPDIRVSEEVCSDCRRIKKNAILLTKDGSVGIAYKAECDLEMVTSGAILHLEVKDDSVDPDYLALVLNSRIVRMQAERDAGGSIIQHWKPSQIEKVQIPILPRGVQHALADKVRESFRLRHESKRLLNLAKSAVEKAIEDGEEAAVKFIEEGV
ncbi:MAG: restriction endonuclease subunit S [Kiritimatiellae bacterium]|nr:restriction endonuclease subunit S [Kiritimatiellia bacterium]